MNFPSKRQILSISLLILVYSLLGFFVTYRAFKPDNYEAGTFYVTLFTSGLVPVSALITILFSLPKVGEAHTAGEPKEFKECSTCGRSRSGHGSRGFAADRSVFIIGQPIDERSIRIDDTGVQMGNSVRRDTLSIGESGGK